jgi:murein DD-endopeptidase MepM/ murein hydrolase activator NlpD
VKTDGVAGHGPAASGATPSGSAATKAREQARTAGKQLEAFFLRQLLSETRPRGGGELDGGFAGDTFKQMLDEAIADKMSAAGGIGMAKMFAKQLGGADEVTGPHPPAPAAATAILGHSPAALPSTHAAPVATAVLTTAPAPGVAQDPDLAGAPRFVLPVAGRPSSGYGMRTDPIRGGSVNHPGFDLAAATGTEVAAAARGTVVHAGPAGTYGNLVTLRHDNGFETRYAHLSEVDVKVGDLVEAGAELGKVGTTGYSTGPHLHFEVRHDGQAIDPVPLLPLNSSPPRTTR